MPYPNIFQNLLLFCSQGTKMKREHIILNKIQTFYSIFEVLIEKKQVALVSKIGRIELSWNHAVMHWL